MCIYCTYRFFLQMKCFKLHFKVGLFLHKLGFGFVKSSIILVKGFQNSSLMASFCHLFSNNCYPLRTYMQNLLTKTHFTRQKSYLEINISEMHYRSIIYFFYYLHSLKTF